MFVSLQLSYSGDWLLQTGAYGLMTRIYLNMGQTCIGDRKTLILTWKTAIIDRESSLRLQIMNIRQSSLWKHTQPEVMFLLLNLSPLSRSGWVGLWGFLWWAPSAKGKGHHGVSSGWSSVWHRSNTGLSSTQYEQIPIILGVWPFWLTPFLFQSITFWRAYG